MSLQDDYRFNNSFGPSIAGLHPSVFVETVNPNDLTLTPSTSATQSIEPSLISGLPTIPTGVVVAESLARKRQTTSRRIQQQQQQQQQHQHHRDPTSQHRSAYRTGQYIPTSEVQNHIKMLREILERDRTTGEVRTRPFKNQKDMFKPFIQLTGSSPRERMRMCLVCGYHIKNGTQIIQHVMDHFGHYPFQCNEPDWYMAKFPDIGLNE
jgi:hypothetical protein